MNTLTTTPTLTLTHSIHAPLKQVYLSLTDRDWLRDWLCDDVTLNAIADGYLLLTWYEGGYAFGRFTALESDQRVAFTLRGRGEATEALVEFTLMERDGTVGLSLSLSGYAPDDAAGLRAFWSAALDRLKHVLETGADKRFTERVLVGITPDTFNADVAQKLGVPVTEGVLVSGTLAGLGAAAAGVKASDVIVAINGEAITPAHPISAVTGRFKPDDTLDVTLYRGAEKLTVAVKLSGYPVPPVPADTNALAERLAAKHAEMDAKLAALFEGVSEERAAHNPAPAEWSACDVLAHLILSERWTQEWVGTLLSTPESTGWSNNLDARLAAVRHTFPTVGALHAELRRAWAETAALVRALPAEFTEHKANLWWASFELDAMTTHAEGHLLQIEAALK